MIKRIKRRASILIGGLGVHLLSISGLYSGFFKDWRWAIFDKAERMGIHILPVHYYTPIPASAEIKFDDQTSVFAAVSGDVLDSAVNTLSEMVDRYKDEYSDLADRKPFEKQETISEFRFGLAPYSTIEAELLYGLVRSAKPSQIIEIGSGHTTLLIAEAIRAEAGYSPVFECIEPYRPKYLQNLPPEVTTFNDSPLQSITMDRFREMGKGDILFIDSSHVVNYGSDVVYEICAILPNLSPGVLVHFHDIFLPYEYPTEWIENSKFFWNEQYMISALVQGSQRYKVVFPLHQIYRERRKEMDALFPLLVRPNQRPGAYWLEIVG